ncbi:phage tail protein I [Pseudomonas sp. SDI]|uniref:phage tail protein I n=1 Tax=Pseudomonas sp. SDI TaxID=2170734 RepID=UPI000DE6D2FB|nr:phage tail protein I [Pseudomonas sp. SDI]PWB34615.1 phage tail protein I [Pseudomonas sp. SDI]
MKSFLPLNRTPLERALEVAAEDPLEVALRALYNPDTCPVHLLHQLAWAWSVDRWDDSWPEAIKRSVIRSSFGVHARKGTIGALRQVVEPFGYLIDVVEWFQTEPQGVAGTFSLKIGVSETGITEDVYRELSWLIDDAKPVTRHMTQLDISLETRLGAYQAVAVCDGDVLEVYPWESADIEIYLAGHHALADHTTDILDVYLNG